MKRILFFTVLGLVCLGCEKTGEIPDSPPGFTPGKTNSLFIVNEGGFNAGNASLSHLNLSSGVLTNNVFYSANGCGLGDTAYSMTVDGDYGWIVVNNSGCILKVKLDGMTLAGKIDNLSSPRNISVLSSSKAYVTQLYSGDILIVNPQECSVEGKISTGAVSTEQVVVSGRRAYVNCWSGDRRILKIDTVNDEVIASLEVGEQPVSLVLDRNGKLWTMTDGGWNADYTRKENPALHMIDTLSFSVERTWTLSSGANVSKLAGSSDGDALYYIDGGIYKMYVGEMSLPESPFIAAENGSYFYGVSQSPFSSDIAVADAGDFSSPGHVFLYSADGVRKAAYETGIAPGGFCWY